MSKFQNVMGNSFHLVKVIIASYLHLQKRVHRYARQNRGLLTNHSPILPLQTGLCK